MTPGQVECSDVDVARRAAEEASRVLRRVRITSPIGEAGFRGDAAAQNALMGVLRRARPHDAVLSEEAGDDPIRLAAERVWIVDPLDGTREFGERDRVDWAVHVALWQRGDLTAGAVALPALGITLTNDGPRPTPPPCTRLRIAVSRSRPPSFVPEVAERLGAEIVPLGSAGFKVCAVVRGKVDAYLHAGGQYEWDSAAPVAVARAAGLHTSRLDGSQCRYNQPDPSLPDLLVCRPELAATLLRAVSDAGVRQ